MTKKTTVLLTDSNKELIQDIQYIIQETTNNKISMSKIINIAIKELCNKDKNKELNINHCLKVLKCYNLI